MKAHKFGLHQTRRPAHDGGRFSLFKEVMKLLEMRTRGL